MLMLMMRLLLMMRHAARHADAYAMRMPRRRWRVIILRQRYIIVEFQLSARRLRRRR